MPTGANERASTLLLEECFSHEDARFLEILRQLWSPKFLAPFADRWKKDPRPWARRQIFDYLEQPLDCRGHQPLVKHLFKHAEEQKDDTLMAAFLVAFDRLVRRVPKTVWRWDPSARKSHSEEVLYAPRNTIPLKDTWSGRSPATGEIIRGPARMPRHPRLFRYRTRYHLRRRAWRYFRYLGFKRPADYPGAVAQALRRYRDEDLAAGENLLDSWGLMHACFQKHAALEFLTSQVRMRDGRSPAELSAAPMFAEAWQTPAGADALLSLVTEAQSQLVRVWAMQCFRQVQAKAALPLSADKLLLLLEHADEQVQQFGAELLGSAPGLEAMPMMFWLRLMQTQNLTALQTLCDLFTRHVAPGRLDLAQVIELACAKASPVARLGQGLLKGQGFTSVEERQALAGLANAQCAAVAGELTTLALGSLGTPENYEFDQVVRFFDSLREEARAAAWAWLVAGSPGYNDPALWSRLTETPFDDLRLRLVDQLQLRTMTVAPSADTLTPVWCSVLLGVHRGGRQKAKAVRQISEAIQQEPARASSLLPVLAVAVRSVRAPEARAGLAAVVGAIEARPEIADLVKRFLPELDLSPAEVAP